MTGAGDDVSGGRDAVELLSWPSERAQRGDTEHVTTVVEDEMHVETMSVNQLMFENEFSIPEYQRGFAWDEGNIEEFWQEVERIVTTDPGKEDVSDLFMGSVFLVDATDGGNGQEVIDGQQRLTTFTLLIKILHDELEGVGDLADSGLQERVDLLTGGGFRHLIYRHLSSPVGQAEAAAQHAQ
jgi:hypothetical protein